MITGQPSQSSIGTAQVVLFYVELYFRSGVYAFCRDVPMSCVRGLCSNVTKCTQMCTKCTQASSPHCISGTATMLIAKLLNNFIITELLIGLVEFMSMQ